MKKPRADFFGEPVTVSRQGLVLALVAIIPTVAGLLVILRSAANRRDAWVQGDWLIDYSAGFSRRGIVG